MAADIATQLAVERLIARYVASIDADRLEEWPDYFTERCSYRITTSENHEQGLPLGVFFADSRAMLQDRVAALRRANVYEGQRYRHLVSSIRAERESDGLVAAQSHFMVARIMQDGATTLFATGRYLDRIDLGGGAEPLFTEKLVLLDSRRIDTLLAIPL